jgi:hypothetical protein
MSALGGKQTLASPNLGDEINRYARHGALFGRCIVDDHSPQRALRSLDVQAKDLPLQISLHLSRGDSFAFAPLKIDIINPQLPGILKFGKGSHEGIVVDPRTIERVRCPRT